MCNMQRCHNCMFRTRLGFTVSIHHKHSTRQAVFGQPNHSPFMRLLVRLADEVLHKRTKASPRVHKANNHTQQGNHHTIRRHSLVQRHCVSRPAAAKQTTASSGNRQSVHRLSPLKNKVSLPFSPHAHEQHAAGSGALRTACTTNALVLSYTTHTYT